MVEAGKDDDVTDAPPAAIEKSDKTLQ